MYNFFVSILLILAGSSSAFAGVCETAEPSGSEKTNSTIVCVAEGHSHSFKFETYPNVTSIRVFRDGCETVSLAPGRATLDLTDLSFKIGPVMATGCYMIKWNEVR